MAPMLCVRAFIASLAMLGAIGVSAGVDQRPRDVARNRAEGRSRMSVRMSADLRSHSLKESLDYVCMIAGLECQAFWADEQGRAGLDSGAMVDVRLKDATVEEAIERILGGLETEGGDEPTWQMTRGGVLQIGPRSRLNRYRRVEVYPIADLVREVPDFAEVPKIDLAAALQPGGGGTIFSGDEGPGPFAQVVAETPAERLLGLLVAVVEPAQWEQNGGTGGSIHIWRDSLVIDAPEYMHRRIGGGAR